MKDAMVAESALFGMGTVINHQVYGKNATEALAAANTETTRLEELLSRFRPHSEISGINRSAGEWGNGVGIETYEVLTKAVGFSNFGGNVATIGTKSDGSFWRVGIRHPRQENALIGAVSIAGKSVVTSGDYQRYFIGSDGQRYHHIINPATGYYSESGLISATVVADSSMVADALSTALFVAGLHQGISLLGTVPGIEAILITADLRVHITPGLIDSFVAQKGINVNIIYRKAEKPKSGVVYLKDKKVKERKGRRTGKMIGWTITLVIMAAIGIGAAIGMPKLSRVESGRVTKVEFLQSKENQKPEFTNTLINRVIEAQSLQVDAISGATLTSKVYLQGIENALKGAMAGESK